MGSESYATRDIHTLWAFCLELVSLFCQAIVFCFNCYFLSIVFFQAEELRKSLWEKQVPAKVYVGMRYWHPFTEEAIEQVLLSVQLLISFLVMFNEILTHYASM
jgi:hypothetical protein